MISIRAIFSEKFTDPKKRSSYFLDIAVAAEAQSVEAQKDGITWNQAHAPNIYGRFIPYSKLKHLRINDEHIEDIKDRDYIESLIRSLPFLLSFASTDFLIALNSEETDLVFSEPSEIDITENVKKGLGLDIVLKPKDYMRIDWTKIDGAYLQVISNDLAKSEIHLRLSEFKGNALLSVNAIYLRRDVVVTFDPLITGGSNTILHLSYADEIEISGITPPDGFDIVVNANNCTIEKVQGELTFIVSKTTDNASIVFSLQATTNE